MLRGLLTALAAVALAWVGGGQALLGRIDPALAVPLLMLPMLLLAWWQRRAAASRRAQTVLTALVFLILVQAALGWWLAGTAAWLQLVLTILSGGVAAFAADALVQRRPRRRWLVWTAAALLLLGWFGASHAMLAMLYRPAAAPRDAPVATILTGLPLRWSSGQDMAAMIAQGAHDDPALAQLQGIGPLVLVDSLVDAVPPPGGSLLLIHPRALAPQELVAIDAFVRGGGHAVVLADALSGWPLRYPLGDPRNPPVTSLLTPLLDHWGIVLSAAPTETSDALPVDVGGARLILSSAGLFDRLPGGCRAFADRHVARCGIGAGGVWLVGDADLLFAPLWQPPVTGAAHLRRADTLEWVSGRLWSGAGRARLSPVWIRSTLG